MYLRKVIKDDAFVCHRGELHPMSYNISHNLCNCSLTSTHLLVACMYTCQWHWSKLRPEGTARLRRRWLWRTLAKMKCPSNYLSGLTKYVLTSSILPIPVAINGYVLYGRCIKHVLVNMPNTFLLLSLPFYRHLGHSLLWQHLPCDFYQCRFQCLLSLLQLTVESIFKQLHFNGYKLTKHDFRCC